MSSKLIGGVLLIIGTSMGAAMLALPVSMAAIGFLGSCGLLLVCWLVMTLGALCLLEVSLWLPDNNNMISMAGATLGRIGQAISWFVYLLLLYALVSAYIAGGSDVMHYLFSLLHLSISLKMSAILFTVILGYIVYRDVKSVDYVNRVIMTIKFLALFILMILVLLHIKPINLTHSDSHRLLGVITIVLTSFGYATIIPTVRTYFKGDIDRLKQAIIIGSLIPLLCYSIWILAIIGAIEPSILTAIARSPTPTSDLTRAIVTELQAPVMMFITRIFTSVCMFTSFLGVSLGLSDFWADGLNLPKQGKDHLLILFLTFALPLTIVLLDPHLFLIGLSYAGVCCTILLVLLPALMVYSGRYCKDLATARVFPGGRVLLMMLVLVSLVIVGLSVFYDILA